MKKNLLNLLAVAVLCFTQTSCASLMVPKAGKLPLEPTHKRISINSTPSGAEVYMDGKYLGVTPLTYDVPLKYQYLATGMMLPQERFDRSADLSATTFKFVRNGYETIEAVFKPTIAQRFSGYRNYNGQVLGLDYTFPEGVFVEMNPSRNMASIDTTIPVGESGAVVTRDAPGATALEKTIIRWFFDSEPRGARVFWRVISSVPAQVKNTNESYLGTTPFEETRSFNILGLTYENSRDVQVEVKITKPGYMEQTKRFNVRQAIDQMEISSFYDLVPRD